MTDIPDEWHPESRRIAERYLGEFKDRYAYWKDALSSKGAVELQFIIHMANKLYSDARDFEETNPSQPRELIIS